MLQGQLIRIDRKIEHKRISKIKAGFYNMEIEKESDDSNEYIDTIEDLDCVKTN